MRGRGVVLWGVRMCFLGGEVMVCTGGSIRIGLLDLLGGI